MKNLVEFILEKLHINKHSNLGKFLPSKEEFMKLLKNFKDGIDMKQVFGKNNLPRDDHEIDIEEISVKQDIDGYDEMYYSYFYPEDGFEDERVLDLDIFSPEQIIKIYDYMQEHATDK